MQTERIYKGRQIILTMESFINKIFSGKTDNLVHLQFEKFSRGEYREKAMIKAKCSKGAYSISTTAEFANDFVRAFAHMLGKNKAKVSGVIISTRDLSGIVQYDSKKQFMGIKQYGINKELSGEEITALCNEIPRSFFALSMNAPFGELKIKPKAPKSMKPSSGGDKGPKVDFCKVKTTSKELVKAFIFETADFSTFEAEHTFKITDIELPKGVTDPLQLREKAIRKGTIVRKIKLDGKDKTEEKGFVA